MNELGISSHSYVQRRACPYIAGVDPETDEIVRLFNPRQDSWQDHFEWHEAVLIGRTPVGRVTVDVLAINLPYRIQLQWMLILEGVFPPS